MKLRDYLGYKTQLLPNPEAGGLVSGENIGLEIELENLPLTFSDNGILITTVPPEGWVFHKDNSLRNKGGEFVFKTPAGGVEVQTRLTNLENYIHENDWKPECSNRCSVHVHVDAGNCGTAELLKWILIYMTFEPLLFAEYAPDRETSNFCLPVYQSEDTMNTISLLKGKKSDHATTDWKAFIYQIKLDREQRRYSAMNLDSLRKFGTLEFRHLGAEWKKKPIEEWVNVLLSLKNWAMNPETSVREFFHGPSKIYSETLAYRVFGFEIASRLIRSKRFKELYLKGVRAAQEVYLMADIPNLPKSLKPLVEKKLFEKKQRLIKLVKSQISKFDNDIDTDDLFIKESIKKSKTVKKKINYVSPFDNYTWPTLPPLSTTVTVPTAPESLPEGWYDAPLDPPEF